MCQRANHSFEFPGITGEADYMHKAVHAPFVDDHVQEEFLFIKCSYYLHYHYANTRYMLLARLSRLVSISSTMTVTFSSRKSDQTLICAGIIIGEIARQLPLI